MIYLKVANNKDEPVLVKTTSCLVKCTKNFSEEFIFDSVGNEVIKVLGFSHLLHEGASFLDHINVYSNMNRKIVKKKKKVHLASATPAACRNNIRVLIS